MKTLLTLITIATLTYSCNKDKQYCWTCDVTLPGSGKGTVDTTRTVCNATKESIKKLEEGGAYNCKKAR